MGNSELNGLRVIVDAAVERGTLHIVKSPPTREDFDGDDMAFEAAYMEWWRNMHLWTGTVRNIGD